MLSGKLSCKSCDRVYPIINTIPRVLPDHFKEGLLVYSSFFNQYNNHFKDFFIDITDKEYLRKKEINKQKLTQKSFGYQWTTFAQMSTAFEENFMNYINPIKKSYFKGKRGLDVGCGFGRHIFYSASFGAEMVGLDLSSAIDSTYENTRRLENVFLIQGDIYNLPLKEDQFDFVYCVGVLHHLPNPFKGFKSILKMVKHHKDIFIWVYSKARPISNSLIESVRTFSYKIPFTPLYYLCYVAAFLDWTVIGPYKLLSKNRFFKRMLDPITFTRVKLYAQYPFQVSHADWFDRLSVPIRFYYNKKDLEEWFKETHVESIAITPTEKYGWRAYGRKK